MEGSSSSQSQPVQNGSSNAAQEQEQKQAFYGSMAYVNAVKNRLIGAGEREKFSEFLKALDDWVALRINRAVLIETVKELLEGHPDLILAFNCFHPESEGPEIRPDEDLPHDQKPGW